MKSTIEFLDNAKEKLGNVSDYRLAKILKIQQSSMSQYRNKKRTIDDYAATQIAKILEINEMLTISAANAEREKTEERRDFWVRKYHELEGGYTSLSLLIMTATLSIAVLSTFIMSTYCILC